MSEEKNTDESSALSDLEKSIKEAIEKGVQEALGQEADSQNNTEEPGEAEDAKTSSDAASSSKVASGQEIADAEVIPAEASFAEAPAAPSLEEAPTPPVGLPPTQGAPDKPVYHQSSAPGSGKATGALVCGILAILFCWVPLVGLILGIIAVVLAAQYKKAFGKESKAVGGKVTGIVGIVFSVLTTIMIVISVMFLGIALDGYGKNMLSSATQGTKTFTSERSFSAQEQDLEKQATELMDDVCTLDESQMQKFAKQLDKRYSAQVGAADSEINFEAMGLDRMAFAKQWVEPIAYTIDDIEITGDKAYVYLDFRHTNDFVFASSLALKLTDFFASNGLNEPIDRQSIAKDLGVLLQETLDETQPSSMSWSLLYVKDDEGAWVVDKNSYDNLEYLLYGYNFKK